MEEVEPSGYWSRLRQLPGRHYADIDDEALRVSGDLLTRLRQLNHDLDLFKVEVAGQQQRADANRGTDDRKDYKADARLRGRRRELLDALHEFEACQTRAIALDCSARVAKEAVYEYAKERFAVYMGKLVNYHRNGNLIQAALKANYEELGPEPPTPSTFAAFTTSKEGPPPTSPPDEE